MKTKPHQSPAFTALLEKVAKNYKHMTSAATYAELFRQFGKRASLIMERRAEAQSGNDLTTGIRSIRAKQRREHHAATCEQAESAKREREHHRRHYPRCRHIRIGTARWRQEMTRLRETA